VADYYGDFVVVAHELEPNTCQHTNPSYTIRPIKRLPNEIKAKGSKYNIQKRINIPKITVNVIDSLMAKKVIPKYSNIGVNIIKVHTKKKVQNTISTKSNPFYNIHIYIQLIPQSKII
jgi:D-alanyl-lipoteichoic acid acyltransferase DltB (MBOAT superfamily)